jgi:hypothetical protein
MFVTGERASPGEKLAEVAPLYENIQSETVLTCCS